MMYMYITGVEYALTLGFHLPLESLGKDGEWEGHCTRLLNQYGRHCHVIPTQRNQFYIFFERLLFPNKNAEPFELKNFIIIFLDTDF